MKFAMLAGVDLHHVSLNKVNLFSANLHGADLYRTNLTGANLSDANLEGALLVKANLMLADLSDADLQGARYDAKDTLFPKGFDPVRKANGSRSRAPGSIWSRKKFEAPPLGFSREHHLV